MAFGFLLIALVLIVTAFLNTQGLLGSQLASDGPGYLKWAAAIIAIGLIGYIPGFSTASKLFLALVLLVILISNKGVFSNLQSAIENPQSGLTPPTPPTVTGNPTINLNGGSSGSAGGAIGQAAGAAGGIGSLLGVL